MNAIDEKIQSYLINAREFAKDQFPLMSESSRVKLIVAYLESAVRMTESEPTSAGETQKSSDKHSG